MLALERFIDEIKTMGLEFESMATSQPRFARVGLTANSHRSPVHLGPKATADHPRPSRDPPRDHAASGLCA